MRVCIHASTRPNIIKQYGLIKECIARNIEHYVLHTGQHYSDNMSQSFFKELGLPREQINLSIREANRGIRIEKILKLCRTVFESEEYKPDVVIVQGDTDSDFAVALCAKLMGIKVAHNEAGIRSNSDIPEEYNRRMIDQFADYMFVPTLNDMLKLKKEKLLGKAYLTGNTVCDCIKANIVDEPLSSLLGEYYFLTLHRNTNTDDEATLRKIFNQLGSLNSTIIFAIHPRTAKMVAEYGINLPKNIKTTEPLSYKSTLLHIRNAKTVITDSGGIQEECAVLGKKCVILRDSTERPYIGSILWNGDIKGAIKKLDSVDKVYNVFNPLGIENISKDILDAIVLELNNK